MQSAGQPGRYALGDWALESGELLREAHLAYRCWGEPNAAGDNFVVLPTYYTGAHADYLPLIGAGRALDPGRFCIVAPALFGSGASTSPSNAHPSQRGARFPRVDIVDNVRAQYRLLSSLGMRALALAGGWSMGGIQAYRWAVDYPQQVRALLPWCSAARCSTHNRVFLYGVRAALTADPAWAGGHYQTPPERGLRAFARVYCGWAYSQAWFRRGGYRDLGLNSAEALLRAWEADHLRWDANDLLTKLVTWQRADVGAGHGGREQALARIRARTILMPCGTDLYFPPQDNLDEAALIRGAELRVVKSDGGHAAGGPGRDPAFMAALEAALRDLLR